MRVIDCPPLPSPEQVEAAAKAAWDLHASIKWDAIPEEWKPFYRDNARVALLAAAAIPSAQG